jgi:hypothetical protein
MMIGLPGGNAIICGVKSKCKHSWDGKTLFTLSNGKKKLEFELLPKEESSVVGGEVTCSLCGAAYTDEFNPYLMEELTDVEAIISE